MSLALLLGVVTLWVRSYDGTDYVSRCQPLPSDGGAYPSRVSDVQVTRGHVRFSDGHNIVYWRAQPDEAASLRRVAWGTGRLGKDHLDAVLPEQSANLLARLGFYRFESNWESSFAGSQRTGVSIPAWLFALILAILPARALLAWRRGLRRRAAGCCPACGYDLRATPARCPECGHAAGA